MSRVKNYPQYVLRYINNLSSGDNCNELMSIMPYEDVLVNTLIVKDFHKLNDSNRFIYSGLKRSLWTFKDVLSGNIFSQKSSTGNSRLSKYYIDAQPYSLTRWIKFRTLCVKKYGIFVKIGESTEFSRINLVTDYIFNYIRDICLCLHFGDLQLVNGLFDRVDIIDFETAIKFVIYKSLCIKFNILDLVTVDDSEFSCKFYNLTDISRSSVI